ncbi:MAG: alpha/beta fold hydrolase [Lachnospiraceae bacterium]|nr:alpha/beta fold hydrolase [Lachnospiraceae bacterium]
MNQLIYLCYPVLGALLLWKAKYIRGGQWNEQAFSLEQTKALQGFCALGVMLHHIAQKTCAPWLKQEVIVHGLDVFVPVGYLLVGFFLFCSGYGLYKSFREKPDYLQGFGSRRFLLPVLVLFLTNFFFLFVRFQIGESIGVSTPFHVSGPQMINGYAWFVYILLLFYLFFYFTFRWCKNEFVALCLVTAEVLLYIAYCDWWMYGNWWYNSVLLFVVGLWLARYEQKLLEVVRKHYIKCVIIAPLCAILFFGLGEYTEPISNFLGITYVYQVGRWVKLVSQMLAAVFFTLSVFLLGMKIKIGNGVLKFMGGITLEFYLVHGLVLQVFGYNESVESHPYIKSVPLLVLVVLTCSLVLSIVLHGFCRMLVRLLNKFPKFKALVWKDIKKVAVGLLVIVLLITLGMSVSAHKESRERQEAVARYAEEYITYATVDGKRMAAYVTGAGEHTVVVLCGLGDFCPTVTWKPLADRLGEQNRVVVLDYFGSGFSDDTGEDRTAENMVYEIHTALESLGEKGPYVLLAHEMSGIYAQLYVELYPQEVEAIVGVDSMTEEQLTRQLARSGTNPEEYRRMLKKQGQVQYLGQRLLNLSGYVKLQWPAYVRVFGFAHSEEEETIMQEMLVQKYLGRTVADETARQYDNCRLMAGKQYPEELPVQILLSYWTGVSANRSGVDWEQVHENLFTNRDIQQMTVLTGNSYLVYTNPFLVAERTQWFIDGLE